MSPVEAKSDPFPGRIGPESVVKGLRHEDLQRVTACSSLGGVRGQEGPLGGLCLHSLSDGELSLKAASLLAGLSSSGTSLWLCGMFSTLKPPLAC